MPDVRPLTATSLPQSACLGSTDAGRKILVHFYQVTGGDGWTHRYGWDDDNPDLGCWFGVTTNDEGRVIAVVLSGKIGKVQGNNLLGKSRPILFIDAICLVLAVCCIHGWEHRGSTHFSRGIAASHDPTWCG